MFTICAKLLLLRQGPIDAVRLHRGLWLPLLLLLLLLLRAMQPILGLGVRWRGDGAVCRVDRRGWTALGGLHPALGWGVAVGLAAAANLASPP